MHEYNTYIFHADHTQDVVFAANALLGSPFDLHVAVAISTLLKVVDAFGELAASTVAACDSGSPGVDVARAERLKRCRAFVDGVRTLEPSITRVSKRSSVCGREASALRQVIVKAGLWS